MIGIVIPVLNEEKCLLENHGYYLWLSKLVELVFVDGGSGDRTIDIAREFGNVVESPCGRALQKNSGAASITSEVMLFLHVDTFINYKSIKAVERAVMEGATSGCFTMNVLDNRLVLRFFGWLVNVRAKFFGMIDGDLGQFMTRDTFINVKGYDQLPIMEDIFMGKKLVGQNGFMMLRHSIDVSARKWDQVGFWKTLGRYTSIYIKYWLGFIKPQRQEVSNERSNSR